MKVVQNYMICPENKEMEGGWGWRWRVQGQNRTEWPHKNQNVVYPRCVLYSHLWFLYQEEDLVQGMSPSFKGRGVRVRSHQSTFFYYWSADAKRRLSAFTSDVHNIQRWTTTFPWTLERRNTSSGFLFHRKIHRSCLLKPKLWTKQLYEAGQGEPHCSRTFPIFNSICSRATNLGWSVHDGTNKRLTIK